MSTQDPFRLEIVTPERQVYAGEAESVVLPGSEGEIGVLQGHAPMLTILAPGEISCTRSGTTSTYATSGGILEIRDDTVIVAVETAELPSEIDVDTAMKARELAREKIDAAREPFEIAAAELELRKAEARLKVSQKNRSGQDGSK